MAQSISAKVPVVSGYNVVVNAHPPFQGTLSSFILSSNEDVEWEIFIDKPNMNDLARMLTFSLSAESTGGTIPRDTIVYFRITTVDVGGRESPPTAILSKKTGTSNNSRIDLSWAAIADATAYRVYASSKAGQEYFMGEVAGLTYSQTFLPGEEWGAIPTAPDINFAMLKGQFAVPLNSNISLSAELKVYAKVTTGASVTFSTIVS